MRTGRQVVVVGVVLAGLLLVLALLATATGPATFGQARTGGLVDGPLLPVPQELVERLRPEQRADDGELPRWLPVLVLLGASMLAALVVRLLRRRPDDTPAPRDDAAPATGDAAGEPQGVALDDVRRALVQAADEVHRVPGGVADAVVTCWERLEALGEAAGTPRAAHETPTEYGADLLRRHGADGAAVDDLLRLYHRARFGRGELPTDAADRAAAALTRVAGSLGPAPVRVPEGG